MICSKRLSLIPIILSLALVVSCGGRAEWRGSTEATMTTKHPKHLRVATFNAALNREEAGALANELNTDDSAQARKVAEIIQRVNPDVLVLQEFDWDDQEIGIRRFQAHYLSKGQGGASGVAYPHVYQPKVNTGEPSHLDLSHDGNSTGPDDAFGFGKFPGQYGFVILSKYPFDRPAIRTFQRLLWASMPGAKLPKMPDDPSRGWYNEAALQTFRLSSKNHVDVPVVIAGQRVHLLVSHPTPPVFDGPENRNGLRNHDEIRLWADYITPAKAGYIVDDAGQPGGLDSSASFVIAGDLNADPVDGDSVLAAAQQLLNHDRVHRDAARGRLVPRSEGGRQNAKRPGDEGNPAYDTAAWGLRVDYVLPSKDLSVTQTGVFWPSPQEKLAYLVATEDNGHSSSDHRLVWVDIDLSSSVKAPSTQSAPR